MCSRAPTRSACCRHSAGSEATIFRRADAAAVPRPRSVAAAGSPASSSACDSGSVRPVSVVLQPSRSWKPPVRPGSPQTGTPAAESWSMSRRMVRVDTSSVRASAGAVSRPCDCSSIRIESSRLACMVSFDGAR